MPSAWMMPLCHITRALWIHEDKGEGEDEDEDLTPGVHHRTRPEVCSMLAAEGFRSLPQVAGVLEEAITVVVAVAAVPSRIGTAQIPSTLLLNEETMYSLWHQVVVVWYCVLPFIVLRGCLRN